MKSDLLYLGGILTVILLLSLAAQVSADIDSSCGSLSTANTIYTLNNDVNSSGTCFIIDAGNVTLDCLGHTINYSQSVVGVGVSIQGVSDSTVRNCVITQGSLTNTSYGINISGASDWSVANNTIETIGYNTDAIFVSESVYGSISGNDITASGTYSFGTYFDAGSSHNTFSHNNVLTSGFNGTGVQTRANYSTFTHNTISTLGEESHGIYLSSGANNVSSNLVTVEGEGSHAVYIDYISGVNVLSNTLSATSETGSGIYLDGAENNTLSGNTIKGCGFSGIYLYNEINYLSENNRAYNNLLNNSVNVYVCKYNISLGECDDSLTLIPYMPTNYFNVTIRSGTRIHSSGSYIGGNYYTNPAGNGYSDICTDGNGNGFCDSALNFSINNSDYLALTDQVACEILGDYSPCGAVSLQEVVDFIQIWIADEASLSEVIQLINAWVNPPQ